MRFDHDGVAVRKRIRHGVAVLAALALTTAGVVGFAGQAQAVQAVTVKLTAQRVCDSDPFDGPANTTLATANITFSFEIRLSGELTGLTPGHSYFVHTNGGNEADPSADIGTADANGNLTFTNALDDGGANGYRGMSEGAGIFDLTNGSLPEGIPVATAMIPIADNCSRLIAGTSHDRLIVGTLRLIQQGDGNLVLYQGGKALWSARTGGHPAAQTVLQGDGNLVIYSPAGKALWSARTNQKNANSQFSAILVLQRDKNLVLYQNYPVAKVLWATYTN